MNRIQRKLLAILLAVMVAMAYAPIGFAEEMEQSSEPANDNTVSVAEETTQTKEESKTDEGTPEVTTEPEQNSSKPGSQTSSEDSNANDPVEPAKAEKGSKYIEIDNSTSLEDGEYKIAKLTFTRELGNIDLSCDKVIVSNGKATAILRANSVDVTHFFTGTVDKDNNGDDANIDIYNAVNNKKGKGVYETKKDNNGAFAELPVDLDGEMQISARVESNDSPQWITYSLSIKIYESKKERIGEKLGELGEPAAEDDSTEPSDSSDTEGEQKLSEGTWKVKATTSRDMFYLYPKDTNPADVILNVSKDGKMTATIILSGSGYDYLYMGTPDQARGASKSNWIKAEIKNKLYYFNIPVSELDKKLDITPHSSRYEADGDITTDPWRPDKWIIFYSEGAKKVEDGTTIKPEEQGGNSDDSGRSGGTQTKPTKDKKPEKESKWKDDKNKSTSAVNNSTSLKDGVYSPDRFSWSGGSGRLAYIRCVKITVRNGKSFATIEFGSSKYDSLKANGRVYSKQGGGNSRFTIPIKLNANNTIIGRTTAMSQPHWVKYTIFVYKAGASSKNGAAAGTDGHVTNTNKLSDKAPDLLGLELKETVKIKHAKLFKMFKYEQGIVMIAVDQSSNTALYKKPSKKNKDEQSEQTKEILEEADAAGGTAEDAADMEKSMSEGTGTNEAKIEYDEEGKPIPKSDSIITDELYQNNVVNYLIVPKDVELPAGLEKDCVIIRQPVDKSFVSSEEVLEMMGDLGVAGDIAAVGVDQKDIKVDDINKGIEDGDIKTDADFSKPDYRQLVMLESDFSVLPSEVLPAKVGDKSSKEDKELSEEKEKNIRKLQLRYSSLSIPLLVNRSDDEESNYAQAEWVKVYGAIFGEEEKADELFGKFVKENKKEKVKNEE